MGGHISLARADVNLRGYMECPTCERRRRYAGFFQEWYGATMYCLGCGDVWTDGEMHERPFRPRWRTKNKARAREYWTAAGSAADRKAQWAALFDRMRADD